MKEKEEHFSVFHKPLRSKHGEHKVKVNNWVLTLLARAELGTQAEEDHACETTAAQAGDKADLRVWDRV